MKKQIVVLSILVATAIFYFALLGALAGIVLTVFQFDILYVALLAVSVFVLAVYALVFYLKPSFRKVIFSSMEHVAVRLP